MRCASCNEESSRKLHDPIFRCVTNQKKRIERKVYLPFVEAQEGKAWLNGSELLSWRTWEREKERERKGERKGERRAASREDVLECRHCSTFVWLIATSGYPGRSNPLQAWAGEKSLFQKGKRSASFALTQKVSGCRATISFYHSQNTQHKFVECLNTDFLVSGTRCLFYLVYRCVLGISNKFSKKEKRRKLKNEAN